jgi:SAM-dependent methyltransferase
MINRIMGNWRWLARELQRLARPGERVLEIGAGSADFLHWLSRSRPGGALDFEVTGLDLAPRPKDWPQGRGWHQADLLDFDGFDAFDVVLASLTLHHFAPDQLAVLGKRLAGGPRVVLACEPARRRLHLWQARALVLLGINRVTRHDAPASVGAGFRGRELPDALGLHLPAWSVVLASTWLGGYRMAAVRLPPP